jgi:hypothetical protein
MEGHVEEIEAAQKPGRAVTPLLVSMLLVLPILYALSAGPAVYLQTREYIEISRGNAIDRFYYPLTWGEMHCKPFGDLMRWYAQLWEYRAPSPPTQPASNGQ